jgi:hypothetical protein
METQLKNLTSKSDFAQGSAKTRDNNSGNREGQSDLGFTQVKKQSKKRQRHSTVGTYESLDSTPDNSNKLSNVSTKDFKLLSTDDK